MKHLHTMHHIVKLTRLTILQRCRRHRLADHRRHLCGELRRHQTGLELDLLPGGRAVRDRHRGAAEPQPWAVSTFREVDPLALKGKKLKGKKPTERFL